MARGDAGQYVDRPVLCVYDGTFNSMDGEVTVTPADVQRLVNVHNARLASAGVKDGQWVPERFPPIQLDHNNSATVTIGRLFGPLSTAMVDIPVPNRDDPEAEPVTEQRLGMIGVGRFLGADNVEKVEDGRWVNLSLGFDLVAGLIKELTVTPFPAAEHARRLSQGDDMDPKKLKRFLKRTKKLTDEDTEKHFAALSDDEKKELTALAEDEEKRFKQHFTGAGLSEKETDEKMSRMSDEDSDKLSSALAAKLAADEDSKKEKDQLAKERDELKAKLAEKDDDGDNDGDKKKLAARREKVVQLFAGSDKLLAETKAAALESTITVRLARFQEQGKITPAERKKIDIKALALKGAAAVDERLSGYADREPVVFIGQLGSVAAVDVKSISRRDAKALQKAQIEEESRKRMGMKPNDENVRLLKGFDGKRFADAPAGDDKAAGSDSHLKHLEEYMSNIEKCAGEGNVKDMMKHLDGLRKALSGMAFPPMGDGAEKQMAALSEQVEKLTTELASMKTKAMELIAS